MFSSNRKTTMSVELLRLDVESQARPDLVGTSGRISRVRLTNATRRMARFLFARLTT